MDFLKELFGENALTWDEFSQAVSSKGFKVADLSTGKYVDKRKFDNEIKNRETTITDLQGQLSSRDTDITNLKNQLEDTSKDTETKVSELTNQISKLQGDYSNAQKEFENKLNAQSYDFAVREYANSKQFTSSAAKRDFINEMLSENLKMKDKLIMGADDFMKAYSEANPDAIKVEVEEKPQTTPTDEYKPTFIQPTPPTTETSDNAFINAFNFIGVREHK